MRLINSGFSGLDLTHSAWRIFFGIMYLLPPASLCPGYGTRSSFKQSKTSFNSEFSFSYIGCFTNAKKTSLPYYLPTGGRRKEGFEPFPRALAQNEMQTTSFKIQIWVIDSIFNDDDFCEFSYFSSTGHKWIDWSKLPTKNKKMLIIIIIIIMKVLFF